MLFDSPQPAEEAAISQVLSIPQSIYRMTDALLSIHTQIRTQVHTKVHTPKVTLKFTPNFLHMFTLTQQCPDQPELCILCAKG
jgi:hypothetical protein